MTEFRVVNPNKWLAELARRYPDEKPGLDDVANHIDNLRYQLFEARHHLNQIIKTANIGITRSAPSVECEHDWVEAVNPKVSGMEICTKCHAGRATMPPKCDACRGSGKFMDKTYHQSDCPHCGGTGMSDKGDSHG